MQISIPFYRLLICWVLVGMCSACNKEDSFVIGQSTPTSPSPVVIGTYALRSASKSTYLTVTNNTVIIANTVTSNTAAQWVFLQAGTSIVIKNKSTNTYLSSLGANLLSANSTAVASQWIQQLLTGGVYRFINSGNINTMLNVETGVPAISTVPNSSTNANWILVPI